MGLTIHYSGSFIKDASLPEMISEVKDIAEIYKWKYHVEEDQFPKNSLGKLSYNNKIYGIHFTPPDCETISLTFLSNGRMSTLEHLQLYDNTKNEETKPYLYMLWTKTQFAGAQTHKVIVHLLKYLSKKYFSEFKVTDEGTLLGNG